MAYQRFSLFPDSPSFKDLFSARSLRYRWRNGDPVITTAIMAICIVVWAIEAVLFLVWPEGGNAFVNAGMLLPATAVRHPWTFITSMFLHQPTSLWHILFNMYSLFIFGCVLEHVWGGKKFLLFYLVTGIGAALIHSGVMYLEAISLQNALEAGNIAANIELTQLYTTPTVGASGAIYGLLLAYGMLFPNNVMQLIFPPVALKAKYFVLIFGALELLLGITNSGGSIAHFAHLGGMIFGYFLIMYWKKQNRMYY